MQTELRSALLEWQAPSRITHERTHGWYVGASIVTMGLVVYGILTGAWSFAVTIAILAGLFFLVRNEKHPLHSIRISELGIEFDGVMHPWVEWKDFWMLASPDHCELHIESKKSHRADLIIHTGPMNPLTVRDTMSRYLPQNPEKREKLLDAIIRFCKL
jgi:hypothetical protein